MCRRKKLRGNSTAGSLVINYGVHLERLWWFSIFLSFYTEYTELYFILTLPNWHPEIKKKNKVKLDSDFIYIIHIVPTYLNWGCKNVFVHLTQVQLQLI